MRLESASFFESFNRNIKKAKSFTLTGLTTFSRLLLLNEISKLSNKKVLFITSTEQAALKYSADIERLFDKYAETIPYQNTSPYETVNPSFYDYQKQISILLKSPEIVIAPVKVLLEKFPKRNFFDKNSFTLKIGDSISQKELLKKLSGMGYKRSTMVSDIGEFSIRGDIADIYTLEEAPTRVEFWGDEIVDIRFFNNETQKSVEKITQINIKPLYKFILPNEVPKEFSSDLKAQYINERYFEGVNVYQSYFNLDLGSIFDYFSDYIIVFDEFDTLSKKKLSVNT